MTSTCSWNEQGERLAQYVVREALNGIEDSIVKAIQPIVTNAARTIVDGITEDLVVFLNPFSQEPGLVLLCSRDDVEWRVDIDLDELVSELVAAIDSNCGRGKEFPDVNPRSVLIDFANKFSAIAYLLQRDAEKYEASET